MTTARYEPGDEITITIKGKISEYQSGTKVVIDQPLNPFPLIPIPGQFCLDNRGSASFTFYLRPEEAKVTVEHKAKHKNGVHIDLGAKRPEDQYWLRRPDGWHKMSVESTPRPTGLLPDKPAKPQRLKEDRDV